MAKEASEVQTVDAGALNRLLSRVSLGGAIEECVVEIKGKKASIRAIDMSNSLFVCAQETVAGLPEGKLGLGSLSTMCKFLSGDGEFTYTIREESISLKRAGHGSIRFTLLKPEEVPTVVTQKDAQSKLIEACTVNFVLTKEAVTKFLYYMGILASASVTLAGRNGKLSLSSGSSEQNKFTIPMGKFEGDDFETSVYGNFLSKVFGAIPWPEGEDTAEVRLLSGESSPVVIQVNDNNLWAVTPIASME